MLISASGNSNKNFTLVIFLLLIFPAVLCQKYHRHFNNKKKFRKHNHHVLKNQYNHIHSLEDDRIYFPDQINYESTIENDINEYNTSCKKITCDNVEDYPGQQIKKEFFTNILLKAIPHEIGYRMNLFSFDSGDGPAVLESLVRILESNKNIPIDIRNDGSCEKNTSTTNLKQALTEKNTPVFVVFFLGFYMPKAVECKAPKYCFDIQTPEGHVNYCKTHIVKDDVYVFDKTKKIIITKVLRPAGCHCRQKRTDNLRFQ